MNPEQWKQVGEIFDAATALRPEERSSFLDQACGEDEALRSQVQSLLELEERAGGFLDRGAMEDVARGLAGEKAQSLIGQRLGHHELLSLIGAGGMGEVYRARDLALKRHVAIKVLPSSSLHDVERLQRFRQEAHAASALTHPNIITIHEIGNADGVHFIVSEYIEGETLRERLKRGRLDANDVVAVTTQIADGLAAAHSVGVVHRDIKPENIMLRPDGLVKILDFGLAKLNERRVVDLSMDARLKTRDGVVLGTTRYMSPEQVRGLTVDERTDVWSLGVVSYEMLAGRAPFEGQTNSDVIAQILEREPAPLSSPAFSAPAELQLIVSKALHKNPDDRYPAVKDMLFDLKRSGAAESLSRQKVGKTPTLALMVVFAAAVSGAAYLAYRVYQRTPVSRPSLQPSLSRVTFDQGLQSEPTWSPDGRFIAYSSDKGGNFDIHVQPIGGGDAVQVTHSSAPDWQPDWSPDGTQIVFRSEREGGGIFTVPVLGGREQKISAFGYQPRWSPDGSQILFADILARTAKLFVVKPGNEPREVLADFMKGLDSTVDSFAWHPDGQRISILGSNGFWTAPLNGNTPVKSQHPERVDMDMVEEFRWGPAGDVLYFQGSSRGVRNLWRVAVDRHSLQPRGRPERLTTGSGPDKNIALSPDGTKLAFTSRIENVRVWSLPFNARAGKLAGAGQPVTAAGVMPCFLDMTRDGKKLVYIARRTGTIRLELREKLLEDGPERVLTVKEYPFFCPRWSPDGTRVAYQLPTWILPDRPKVSPATVILSVDGGEEQKLTSGDGKGDGIPFDWSADGKWVLATTNLGKPGLSSLALLPVSAAPHAETEARPIVSDPERSLYQGRLSPDERWLCFGALGKGGYTVYVVSVSGGRWMPITADNEWADKPRWSPDGRAIYFVSRRGTGFQNVWRRNFDQAKGEFVGEPLQMTFYQSPERVIWTNNYYMDIALSADRLVVPVMEVTGSIWVLEGVNH